MEYTFIFGTGKILEECLDRIPLEHVDFFIDNDAKKWGRKFRGRSIVSAKDVRDMEVHRIYIATTKFFYEIYEQLVIDCGIAREKIKGIYCLLPIKENSFDGGRKIGDYWQVVKDIASSLKSIGAMSVFDDGNGLRDYGVLSPYDDRLSVWRNAGQWDFIRDSRKGCPDTVLFVDPFERMAVDDLVAQMQSVICRWNSSCVIEACGPWDERSASWFSKLRRDFPGCILQQHLSCVIAIVPNNRKNAASIFTVTHKSYSPIFWAGEEAGYKVIFAGAQGEKIESGLRDDEGDNISRLNGKINECTAIYWVWKHRSQPMIGFCHYRRYFLSGETAKGRHQVLTAGEAWRYLQNTDVLVAKPALSGDGDVIEAIRNSTSREAFDCGWKIFRWRFEKKHLKDVAILDDVMHSREIYPCNMFVTRWEIFDAYCTWLFSFLIPAAEEADVSHFDAYSKRIIGFFAERMLTVWLVKHPELRIKTLPILQTDA